MSKPIIDKAEVSIDFPDKFYHGSFGRSSSYDVTADQDGLHILLDRHGEERRHVGFHVQYALLAGILDAAGEALVHMDDMPDFQRQALADSVAKLHKALKPKPRRKR